jgi:RNA ligase (TIGR02306 family)
MARKLASIQRIDKLESILNADKIVLATVMGWKVIVKKDEFSEEDLCVFFEVDSILPDGQEWAEFMRSRKFRVKTLKMRGVLSQGLVLSIDILPQPGKLKRLWNRFAGRQQWKVGDDVTKTLKVKKHDPTVRGPGFDSGRFAGPFPPFIPKTDETRLQSALRLLGELKGHPFYISVKCDGTSGTFYKLNGELFCCSRNRTVKPGDNVYWKIAEKYDLENHLPEGMAIQGEVCGPGIQKNRLFLKEPELFVFDVMSLKGPEYLDFPQMQGFCQDHNLTMVPIVQVVTDLKNFDYSLDNWIELAKGKYEGTKNRREGIVVRPVTKVRSHTFHGGRLSFKVLNNEFLLKDED